MFKKIKNAFYENLYSGEIEMILSISPTSVFDYGNVIELSRGVSGGTNIIRDTREYKKPHYKIIKGGIAVEPNYFRMIKNGRDITKNVSQEFLKKQFEILQNNIGKKYR